MATVGSVMTANGTTGLSGVRELAGLVENNEGVGETFEVNAHESCLNQCRTMVRRTKFCESDIVMRFAANSSPKTSSSCVKS